MDAPSMKADRKVSRHAEAPASSGASRRAMRAVALLDERGCIVDITADAAAMLGYQPAVLLGRDLIEFAAPGWKTVAAGITARLRIAGTDPFEVLLCGRSGRLVLVQMRAQEDDAEVDVAGSGPGTHVLVWTQHSPITSRGGGACGDELTLRRLAYGLMTNHEEEKSRVAAELHDRIVPLVFMAKLMVEDGLRRLRNGTTSQGTAALVKALDRLRDLSDEVRRISMGLHPRMLDDLGLLPTIEWYCRSFSEACPSIRLERHLAAEEMCIRDVLKLEIFRILEEGLNNVAQHSAACSVRVELVHAGSVLRLSITDDGVGFDAAQVVFGDGCCNRLGLQSIRKRICATGGQLILESMPGVGTTIGAAWSVALR